MTGRPLLHGPLLPATRPDLQSSHALPVQSIGEMPVKEIINKQSSANGLWLL